jgi:glucan phosphoethanolaminetransferase (alkaline phosphatase superfamily)
LTILVEIDGGINADTIEQAAEAGVDCFVAGSAVYGAHNPAAAVEALRRQAASPVAHDHLFHTLLGWLDVRTSLYRRLWDLSAACRRPGAP